VKNNIPLEEFREVGIRIQVTENQQEFLKKVKKNIITICCGPAATGKSYCAIAEGIRMVLSDARPDMKVNNLLIVRPAVEAQEDLGYLPGRAEEKIEPYMIPSILLIKKILGKDYTKFIKKINTMTFAFMRGITFENSFVILDEAQNTTPEQMKLFLTRIGRNCKVIIVGDKNQSDIKRKSGLSDATNRVRHIPGIAYCELDNEDCMRHNIVGRIIEAYEGLSDKKRGEALKRVMDSFPSLDDDEPITYWKS